METIDISGLDKAKVLQALYIYAQTQGLGRLQYQEGGLTYDEAQKMLRGNSYFDYVNGRVIKVNLAGDSFTPYLYDRDNGNGAAQRAVDMVRNGEI
jgi:hypothetical protein